MARALFVSYGGGHVGMVLPVMAELGRSQPELDCVLLALTTGHGRALAAGVPALGYRDLLHLVDARAALQWGERLSEGNTSPDVSREETVAYMGINYLDLIAQHGADGAADHYRRHGRYGFAPVHFMRRVLEQFQPDVVVATNSPRSEQAALDVACGNGIPSVGMVDLFGLDNDTYVSRTIRPDWTCVLSDVVRRRLLDRGFDAAGLVVTGNPAFDGLFSTGNRQAAEHLLRERGWVGLQHILWCGHVEAQTHPATAVPAGPGLSLEVEAILRQLVRRNPRYALSVRYHPSQWHTYPRGPQQDRVHFSIPPREPIHPLVLASSLVVVQNSTVGLEGAVAGKPVLSIENAPSVHAGFSLARMGVSTGCPTPRDLQTMVPDLLEHPTRTPGEYASDGRAAARVAQVVARAAERGAGRLQSKSADAVQ